MYISNTTIQNIKSHIRIDEVIADFVQLKQRGNSRNLWACCPFPDHNEKTPSFSVTPDQGFFKCFGCGQGGDTITFLQKTQGMTYIEAMEYLAHKYNIEWTQTPIHEMNQTAQKQESLYLLMEEAQAYYEKTRQQTPLAQKYLASRNISPQIQTRFHLGYSPDDWHALHTFITQKKQYSQKALSETGLIITKNNNTYDRFRGRLIFPIHNLFGQTIAFGARHLQATNNDPKYINSPETSIYQKSKTLYGLYQAKKAIRQTGFTYLVEGYTDVLALHQTGIQHVVASAGTSLTENQVTLLKRFTKHVILLFDNDQAGQKAIHRSIDHLLTQNFHIEIITLPPGEDPASHAQKLGPEPFNTYLENHKQDFLTFLAQAASRQKQPQERTQAIHSIIAHIARIPDPVKQAIYIETCTKLLQINPNILQAALKKQQPQNTKHKTSPPTYTPRPNTPFLHQEETAILAILLRYGNETINNQFKLADIIFTELEDITLHNQQHQELYTILQEQWKKTKNIAIQPLLQEEAISPTIIDIIAEPHTISDRWPKTSQSTPQDPKGIEHLTYKNILRLKLKIIRKMIHDERQKLAALEGETEILQQIALCQQLKQVERDIANHLKIAVFAPIAPTNTSPNTP